MRRMRIRINKEGTATVSVEGAEGPGCLEFTKAFEEAIGSVEKRELKDEYHQETVADTLQETNYERNNL